MFRRPKGAPFTPPPEISRLPMSLLRTNLVTRQPERSARGVEEYQERMDEGDEYAPPMMMPQRVLFQQWKTDLQTDGANRAMHKDPLRSADSIDEMRVASGVPNSTVQRVKRPTMTYEEAFAARARGGQFPEPPEDLEPPEVITRDVPAYGRPLEPPPEAFVTAVQATTERAEVKRNGACQRALFEAQAVQERARMIIRGGR